MGLDRLIERHPGSVGGGQLGHIRALAGVQTVVIEPGRLVSHEASQLHVDGRLGQRVGHPLVAADGHPHTERSLA